MKGTIVSGKGGNNYKTNDNDDNHSIDQNNRRDTIDGDLKFKDNESQNDNTYNQEREARGSSYFNKTGGILSKNIKRGRGLSDEDDMSGSFA